MTKTEQFPWPENKVEPQTYEDLLKEYRIYVNDPKAEFPEEILLELEKQGKIKTNEVVWRQVYRYLLELKKQGKIKIDESN